VTIGDHAISGSTRLVGLLGWPVAHSKSPAMHNAAFAELGLDWCYVPLPTKPAHLGEAVHGLRALGVRGANVTVPHKRDVLAHLDEIEEAARTIGAVNTIVVDDDERLVGHNTDAPGLVRDLRAHGIDVAGATVMLLGAGGAARAAAVGCLQAGAARLIVSNRTQARAEELANVASALPYGEVGCIPWPDRGDAIRRADIVVQCTSLGLPPNADASPLPVGDTLTSEHVAYDLVYGRRTPFLAAAERAGAEALSGEGMLLWQGALAFSLWTGRQAPIDAMRRAL